MNISLTISSLRTAGLTQTQIGSALGLKQSTISDMESGKSGIKRPSHDVVTKLETLAKKYNVATDADCGARLLVGKTDELPTTRQQ